MVRMLSAWVVLGLVAATAGCSMCSHPYDYCGPVHSGGCNGHACNGPRAGSIRAMGGPVFAPHLALPPGAMGSYSEESNAAPLVFKPSSPLDQIVAPLQTPIGRSPQATPQGLRDVRQYLPATDRESAQILSVTDQTLDELQARRGSSSPSEVQPAPTGTWTARRPSASAR